MLDVVGLVPAAGRGSTIAPLPCSKEILVIEDSKGPLDAQGDRPLGAVMAAAVDNGLRVAGTGFTEESYIDIGTPHDLVRAVTASNLA